MLKKIVEFIREKQIFQTADRVIVGISGGADSICLLCVLIELQTVYRLELKAIHINHGIRGVEAKEDELFVKRFCEEKKIPLQIYQENVNKKADEEKVSQEEAGRIIRRERFEEVSRVWEGAKIALAHHQNDQAETVLFNMSRGTGLKGLGGMRAVNERYVRPLLCIGRQEIELYLAENNIPYCTDSTNAEDLYTRNKIRNHVIPSIEEAVNGSAISCVAEMADQMQQIEEYMEKQTKRAYVNCVHKDEKADALCIRAKGWEEEEAVIRQRIVYEALCTAAGKARDIEAIHVKSIMNLFQKQVGKEIHLPYELKAIRNYEEVCIQQNKKEQEPRKEVKGIEMKILEKSERKDTFPETPYTKWFDYDIIKNTVEIRNRKIGDYITIDQQGHTQKLKRLFINQKIPKEQRDNCILVADGSHIIWVLGYRQNPAYRVTAHTNRIIEIKWSGGAEI